MGVLTECFRVKGHLLRRAVWQPLGRRIAGAALAAMMAMHCWMLPAVAMYTLPAGGHIKDDYGHGAIHEPVDVLDPDDPDSPDPLWRQLVVEQTSERLIIDWHSFDIGEAARVVFEQEHGREAVVLNRVTSSEATTIAGRLSAPGQVFIINPHGVVFGQGALVNTGGLAASTLSLSDDDFWDGRYAFEKDGAAGTVVNEGSLIASAGGYVALVAPRVANEKSGTIRAYLGTVAVGAGDEATLHVLGDGLVHLTIPEAATGGAGDEDGDRPFVENVGIIETYGGLTLLTGKAPVDFVGAVVSQQGTVRAGRVEARDGRIVLVAAGAGDIVIGPEAVIEATGDVDVTAAGSIEVEGTVTRPREDDFAEGDNDGGDQGDDGGDHGDDGGRGIGEAAIGGPIDGSVTLHARAGQVSFKGAGRVDFSPQPDDESDGGTVIILYNPVAVGGSHKYMNVIDYSEHVQLDDRGELHAYMLVHDVADLQDIKENMGGSYALVDDIDASATGQEGDAFVPLVGADGESFTGTLDGRGYVVSNLRICDGPSGCGAAEDDEAVGLFRRIGAGGVLRSLGLENVEVSGGDAVGALAGVNEGTVERVYVTGSVIGEKVVGGLVGRNEGVVSDSYTVVDVKGEEAVGGIAGELVAGVLPGTQSILPGAPGGVLRNVYNTGTVTATGEDAASGRLVGRALGGADGAAPRIEAGFWKAEGGPAGAVGSGSYEGDARGLTPEQMKSADFWAGRSEDGWDGAANWNVDSTGYAADGESPWRLYDGQTAPLLKDFLRQVVIGSKSRTVKYDGQQHGPVQEDVYSLTPDVHLSDLPGTLDFGAVYKDAGTYTPALSGLYSTGQRGYDIRYMPGELTITPREITILVSPGQRKIYGEDDPADFAYAAEFDIVEGDTVGFAGRLYREAGENAGTYAIVMDHPAWEDPDWDGETARLRSTNSNYVISGFVGGEFVIDKRPVALRLTNPDIHEKLYGQLYEFGGFGQETGWSVVVDDDEGWYAPVEGDDFSVQLQSSGAPADADVLLDEDGRIAPYGITVGAPSNPNYEIVHFEGGELYVKPAPVIVKPADFQRIYGNWWPLPDIEYEGLVLGQTELPWSSLQFLDEPGQFAPVGQYEIGFEGTVRTANYEVTFTSGTLTIAPRPIKVTVASPGDKRYGEAFDPSHLLLHVEYDGPPAPDGVDEALVNGDELAGAPFSDGFAADADVRWVDDVIGGQIGSYDIGQGNMGHDNYDVLFVGGEIRVVPAPLTVQGPAAERMYGDANPALTPLYEGFVLGQDAGVLGGALDWGELPNPREDADVYDIIPKGLTSGNYSIEFVPGTLTVLPRPVHLRLIREQWEKAYGEAIDASGVLWEVASGDVLEGDELVGMVGSDGFAADADVLVDEAGNVVPYVIHQGTLTLANNPNYDISFTDGSLTVRPARLTVTAVDNERVYGDTALKNPFAVTYDGFRAGDDAKVLDGILRFIAPDPTAPVAPEGYELWPAGLHSQNYLIDFAPGRLFVTPRPVELSLLNPFLTKEYGDALHPSDVAWHVTKGNLVSGDELIGVPASVGFDAAAPVRDEHGNLIVYTVGQGSLNSANNNNYDISFVEGTLTLTPARLDVIAGDVTRYYGDPNPELPVEYRGFKLGEDASVLGGELVLSTVDETADVLIGGYSIVPGGLQSGNYAIRYTRGTLTILPAPLKAVVQDAWRYYGDPNPSFEMIYEGFKLGQDESTLSGRLSVDGPGQSAPADPKGYLITPGGLRSGNYDIEFIPGTLLVKPAPLIITALDAVRRYGSPHPAFAASYDGLKLGQTPNDLVGRLQVDTAANRDAAPGRYALIPSGLSSGNYEITYVDGVLTVVVAPGDIEWPAAKREAFLAAQGGINALTAFGGVRLECVDPESDSAEQSGACRAFGT